MLLSVAVGALSGDRVKVVIFVDIPKPGDLSDSVMALSSTLYNAPGTVPLNLSIRGDYISMHYKYNLLVHAYWLENTYYCAGISCYFKEQASTLW